MPNYVKIDNDGNVQGTLNTSGACPDGYEEVSQYDFNGINGKKKENGEWVVKIKEVKEELNVASMSETEFRTLVLTALGYKTK